MRVRITDNSNRTYEYASLKAACKALEMGRKRLESRFKVERLYEKGYWSNFDKEFLKNIGKANSPEPRCLLVED